jgi:hypothetical protein
LIFRECAERGAHRRAVRFRAFFLLLGACSSGGSGAPPSPGDTGPSDGGAVDAPAIPSDTGPPLDAARDGPPPPPADAAPDGSGPDADPHPPAGATKCGGASFDAKAAADACNAPYKYGGELAYPRACDSLDLAGGSYEVWCAADTVYFWVRFDGVKMKTPYECQVELDGSVYPLFPPFYAQGAEAEVTSGARGETGTWNVRNAFSLLDSQRPGTIVLDATLTGLGGPSGTANAWLVTVQSGCPGSPDGPQTIRSGAALKWP